MMMFFSCLLFLCRPYGNQREQGAGYLFKVYRSNPPLSRVGSLTVMLKRTGAAFPNRCIPPGARQVESCSATLRDQFATHYTSSTVDRSFPGRQPDCLDAGLAISEPAQLQQQINHRLHGRCTPPFPGDAS